MTCACLSTHCSCSISLFSSPNPPSHMHDATVFSFPARLLSDTQYWARQPLPNAHVGEPRTCSWLRIQVALRLKCRLLWLFPASCLQGCIVGDDLVTPPSRCCAPSNQYFLWSIAQNFVSLKSYDFLCRSLCCRLATTYQYGKRVVFCSGLWKLDELSFLCPRCQSKTHTSIGDYPGLLLNLHIASAHFRLTCPIQMAIINWARRSWKRRCVDTR